LEGQFLTSLVYLHNPDLILTSVKPWITLVILSSYLCYNEKDWHGWDGETDGMVKQSERLAQMRRYSKRKGKVLTHLQKSRLTGRTLQGRDLQPEILLQWPSALKWGLGEVQPGSPPSGHTAELPSPVLPELTQCLPQVINQRFRP